MSPEIAGAFAGSSILLCAALVTKARRISRAYKVRSRGVINQSRKVSLRWTGIGVGVVLIAIVLLTSPFAAIVIVPVGGIIVLFTRQQLNAREVARYERQLPHALDAIARSMRSGAGLLIAIQEAGHDLESVVAQDLACIAQQVRLGHNLSDALHDWSERRTLQSVQLASASLSLAIKTGAAQAEVIDGVVATVRQSLSASASARTHATQARASMWALTGMPVMFTVPMTVLDAATRNFLLHTVAGVMVLSAGLALDGLGALWMSRLMHRATA